LGTKIKGENKNMIDTNAKTVECPHCQRKQEVHIPRLRGGASPTVNRIQCAAVECKKHFDVEVPLDIIAGPYLLAEQVA
jgi:hypothetical protein